MARPPLVIAVTTLLIITAGVAAADGASQRDTFAQVMVSDLVIGDNEQRLGPMRAVGIDEGTEEVVIEIDVTTLENHGVDIGHAETDLTTDDVRGGTVVSTAVEDGVITLVFAPDDSVIEVEPFQLTGIDTEDAEAASNLTFDVTFSEGSADGDTFDIINPDQVTPTVAPDTLYTGFGEHQVKIEGIQPADGNITLELDTSVLRAHRVTVDDLRAEVDTAGATVRKTTVKNGIVTVILAPATETVLFGVTLQLSGFGTTAEDTDEQVAAADVTYEVRIDGDAADGIDIKSFDLASGYQTPQHSEATPTERDTTPDQDGKTAEENTQETDETATKSQDGPSFGMIIALIVLGGGGLLLARYN